MSDMRYTTRAEITVTRELDGQPSKFKVLVLELSRVVNDPDPQILYTTTEAYLLDSYGWRYGWGYNVWEALSPEEKDVTRKALAENGESI